MKKSTILLFCCAVALSSKLWAQQGLPYAWVNPGYGNATLYQVANAGSNTLYAAGGGSSALKSTDAGLTWQQLQLPINNSEFNMLGADFVDANTGFIVGDSGIFKTTNGGQSWTNLVDYNNDVRGGVVDFVNANTGWIGRLSIKKTTDGGAQWEDVILANRGQANPVSFHMFSATSGVMVLYGIFDGGKVYTTSDGSAWSQITTTGFDYDKGFFTDATHGAVYKSSFNDTVYITSNGGSSWSKSMVRDTLGEKTALGYMDANTLLLAVSKEQNQFATTKRTRIMRSTDGGQTWSIISLEGIPAIKSFVNISSTEAIAVGEGGLILKTTDAGLTWTNAKNTVSSFINGGAFKDENNGVICGSFGEVFRTTNGGTTWSRSIVDDIGGYLQRMVYVSADSIIGIGYAGYPVLSTDGGQTFTKMLYTAHVGSFYGLYYNASNKLLMMGSLNNILGNEDIVFTSNGGTSYTKATIPGVASITDFDFVSATTGFAGATDTAGTKVVILKTTDGGYNWTSTPMPSSASGATIVHVSFADANNGWVLANFWAGPQLWKTTDGGANWELKTNAPMPTGNWPMNDIYFTHADTGYIVGYKGGVLYTYDGGDNWNRVGLRTNQALRAFVKAGSSVKLLSDYEGVVNMSGSSSNPPTGLMDTHAALDVSYAYPNPTTDKVTVDMTGPVVLSLYDIKGVLQTSTHTHTMDVSMFSAGMYFLSIQSDKGITVQKIIIE